ncbi:MAG: hypothetical protein ACOWWM_06685 [Desulfobacterales bacterium]
MKTTGGCKCLVLMVTIGFVFFSAFRAMATVRSGWPQLPDIVLHECVTAEQTVEPNPMSMLENDFLMITAYEEPGKMQNLPPAGEKPETSGGTKALNLYFVLGLLVAENQSEALVHEMALIVIEKDADGGKENSGAAERQWVLLDHNGDGVLDKASFSEKSDESAGESGSPRGLEIPSEQVEDLQGYFDEAVRTLSKKAANGPAGSCTVS